MARLVGLDNTGREFSMHAFRWGVLCAVAFSSISALAQAPVIGRSALEWEHPRYKRATITPTLVHLEPGQEQKFKIVIAATRLMAAQEPGEVKWSVNDVAGGNATLGTIDATGLYHAPAAAPSPRELYVCAEVPEAANKFLVATVIIGQAPIVYKSAHVWAEKKDDRNARLKSPHGIGLDKDGNVLIADQNGDQVLRYAPDGKYLNRIDAGSGRNPGEVSEPREVTSDVEGRIFVTDSKGDRPRVQVFSHEGKFLQIFGEKGRLPGMLLRAHGMGFDRDRRLFIVDVDNMRVNVYDKDGKSLYDWGTEGMLPGELNAPHGLFVDRSGDVFVTGYYGPTQKFNAEGEFVLAFGHASPPDGPAYFHSVAGDQWGNAYLSVRGYEGYDGAIERGEGVRVSVMKYNNHGDYITGWSYSAKEHSESEVAVGKDGKVYALFKGPKEVGVETFVQE